MKHAFGCRITELLPTCGSGVLAPPGQFLLCLFVTFYQTTTAHKHLIAHAYSPNMLGRSLLRSAGNAKVSQYWDRRELSCLNNGGLALCRKILTSIGSSFMPFTFPHPGSCLTGFFDCPASNGYGQSKHNRQTGSRARAGQGQARPGYPHIHHRPVGAGPSSK